MFFSSKKAPYIVASIKLVGLVLMSMMLSCQQLSNESDLFTIRRPNWWHFYHRGIAYSLKGNWGLAAIDFQTALGIRKGAIYGEYDEKRRAKTYGLHFLNDYFPHRELGICYYFQGDYEKAEVELNLSLDMLPSSRAKLYLSKTREARFSQIERSPNHILIDIDFPDEPFYTSEPFLMLKGRVTSPCYISQIFIQGKPLFIELAEEEYDLEKKIYFEPGHQKLLVIARDLAGNQKKWERRLLLDVRGPSVSFSTSEVDPNGSVGVVVTDDFNIMKLIIDGDRIKVSESKKAYVAEIPLKPSRKITIDAVDKAGNRTLFESRTNDLLKASIQSRKHYPGQRFAYAGNNTRRVNTGYPQPINVDVLADSSHPVAAIDRSDSRDVQISNNNPTSLILADFEHPKTPILPKKSLDTMPPRLKLFPEVGEDTLVTTELYLLDLQVSDSGYIDAVTFELNDQKETRYLKEMNLIKHRFTQTLELEPDVNALKITVRDRSGNEKKRLFNIKRKMDYKWREDLRVTAHLLPPDKIQLEPLQNIDLHTMFTNALLQNPKRLNLVERDPKILRQLLLELKLAESKLADRLRAVKSGKLKPSDWLLEEYVTQWSGDNNWDLVVNIVDVETGEFILTTDIHFIGFDPKEIKFQLQGLVGKLYQQLPTLSAPISDRIHRGLKIPLGKRDNILEGVRFSFISADEKDIDFADPLMWQGQLIQGRVKMAKDNFSLIDVSPKAALDQIDINDLAIVR